VCDVCTDPDIAVTIAVLVRALVETAATTWAGDEPSWRAESLRAAQWRASRFGVAESLVDPVSGELRPARQVLDTLVTTVAPALADAGDLDRASAGVQRVVHENGAARQRAAYERSGDLLGVVDDLITRTEASWATPDVP
jgi:carboxylate-amine ligase